ncbi:MAG: GTP 3',8-cyclase MoaA [Acidimicrobiales bacterium]
MGDRVEPVQRRDLVDTFGRVHRDLRISVTDRCNFRCTYCMPEEGMKWMPKAEILTFEEIERIARLMVEHFGIDSIRLTGGEPTVRAHLPILVAKLAALPVDLALTTNGATLRAVAHDLQAAGLERINISLDTFRADRFLEITRRDELDRVLDGIDAAIEAGLHPIKLNVVVMRGVNDDELLDFARFGREKNVEIRFIEFMPLEAGHWWTHESVVPFDEIVSRVSDVYPCEAVAQGHEPAARFRYLDGRGSFGVIASVTKAFCDSCDRVRLTADGKFRNCLFALEEHDLRAALRQGATDDELALMIEQSVHAKWAGHQINNVQFIRPKRSMSQIGG